MMMGRKEDTRAQILRVSAGMFAARGYHGTGLTELLDAADVARGGFYYHFKSKEAVLLQIIVATIERILASSLSLVRREVDAVTKLRLLCDDLSSAIIENEAGFIVFMREYSALSQQSKERVLALRRQYVERWDGVLQEGAREGMFVIRKTPYVEGILGMWIYSFTWNRGVVPPEVIAVDLAEFVLHGVHAIADVGSPTKPAIATSLLPVRSL